MSYGVGNVGAGSYGPPCGGPAVGGAFSNIGIILVLFILLVIIGCAIRC